MLPCPNRTSRKKLKAPHEGVGVSKVGGIFVHKSWKKRFAEKSTSSIRETTMKESLSDAQEAQAQKLAQAIAQASYDAILALSHRIAAKAYRQHLDSKKTATTGPA